MLSGLSGNEAKNSDVEFSLCSRVFFMHQLHASAANISCKQWMQKYTDAYQILCQQFRLSVRSMHHASPNVGLLVAAQTKVYTFIQSSLTKRSQNYSNIKLPLYSNPITFRILDKKDQTYHRIKSS